jgi:hypothetical protein
LRYNINACIAKEISMPISLRLPTDIESQIAGFSARQGVSKSAVIVRSIQEFLTKNAQPSSLEIYEQAMLGNATSSTAIVANDARRESAEQRPAKLQVRAALRRKHTERSARAGQALTASDTAISTRRSTRKTA